ncbi:titin-like isoform X2 [Xiphophorus maculatus]|uniref:titin-like isoform X2 n=1 Tax=Xiphophorus maculatus TaxID=8083 RepID=UPI000C6D1A67|nr:titin-like isoform X2 [Xiphophorus maculatus]
MGKELLLRLSFFVLCVVFYGNTQEQDDKVTLTADSEIIQHPGGRVTLICNANKPANKPAALTYELFRRSSFQGEKLTGRSNGVFRITEGGIYRCRGFIERFLSPMSDDVTIKETVSNRVSVTMEPKWSQIFSGEKVTLRCEIRGGEGTEWTYEWRTSNRNSPTSSEYRINGATESDSGEYSCRAKSDYQLTDWSNTFRLSVLLRKPRATVTANNTIIPAGGGVTLRCSVDGSADWKISWFKQEFESSRVFIKNNEPDGVLVVSVGGLYSCRGERGDSGFYTETSNKVTVQKTVSIKPTVILQPNWSHIYIGEKVTLKCEIQDGRFRHGTNQWRKNDLDKPGMFQEYTITAATESDNGDYSCRAVDRFSLSVWSDVFTLAALRKPRATVTAKNTIIPAGGGVTLRCSVDGSADWKISWFRQEFESSRTTNIKNNEPDGVLVVSVGGLYSCRGERGDSGFYTETSNKLIVQKTDKLSVSPSWPNPGASVTLSCEGLELQSAGWRFFWYKVVPDPSKQNYRPSYSFELLPGSTNGTEQNSFIINGPTHTAGFVCRAGRDKSVFYTYYSEPEFVWSAGSAAASLTVSPDRVQHFMSESVTLTCKGNSTDWRVKVFTETGRLSDITCSNWGRMTGSTCTINMYLSDSGVYWCESGSGEFSNAVNITVQGDYSAPLLVSPVHPVTEGDPVTLSCRDKKQNLLSKVFFYHNNKLINNDSREELNISAVSKSDEGFYKCQHSGKESPRSWMSVRVTVSSPVSSSFPVMLIVGPVVGIVLIILIILLILLWRCRRSKDSWFISSNQSESSNQSSNRNDVVNQTGRHDCNALVHDNNLLCQTTKRKLSGDVGLYESVKTPGAAGDGDAHFYESVKYPETAGEEESEGAAYCLVEVVNVGHKRKPHERTPYSVLRTRDSGTWSPAATDEAVYSEIAMDTAS